MLDVCVCFSKKKKKRFKPTSTSYLSCYIHIFNFSFIRFTYYLPWLLSRVYGMLLCQNLFSSPLCVCLFLIYIYIYIYKARGATNKYFNYLAICRYHISFNARLNLLTKKKKKAYFSFHWCFVLLNCWKTLERIMQIQEFSFIINLMDCS